MARSLHSDTLYQTRSCGIPDLWTMSCNVRTNYIELHFHLPLMGKSVPIVLFYMPLMEA